MLEFINFLKPEMNQPQIEKYIFKKAMQEIEDSFYSLNYTELVAEYTRYFSDLKIPSKTIKKGEVFYRGRVGEVTVYGAIDDCNKIFTIPHYQNGISAAPPIYASEGRFNRDGISYLYLATNKETCLAETHIAVGQRCSIGEFKCKEDIELLDISTETNNSELKFWYKLLTQPIYDEIKYKYRITQFISEIIFKLQPNGIYYKSTQTEGYNIVCCNPNLFELIEYSERLYTTTSIKYTFEPDNEDDIVNYTNQNNYQQLNSCNTNDEDFREKQIEYMTSWIKYRKSNS